MRIGVKVMVRKLTFLIRHANNRLLLLGTLTAILSFCIRNSQSECDFVRDSDFLMMFCAYGFPRMLMYSAEGKKGH